LIGILKIITPLTSPEGEEYKKPPILQERAGVRTNISTVEKKEEIQASDIDDIF